VNSVASIYHAGNKRAFVGEKRFVFLIHMSSTSNTPHTSRAKLKKIVQDEFASNIRGEIKTAIDDLKNTNKSELAKAGEDLISKFKLIVWGVGAVVSVVFILVGFYVYQYVPVMVKDYIRTETDPIRGDLVPIRERLTKLETATDFLEKLKKITSGQNSGYLKDNLAVLISTLHEAREKDILLDPKDVEGIGLSLIKVRQDYPESANEAWSALGQVLNYRSYLNYKLYSEANIATIRPTSKKLAAIKLADPNPTAIIYHFQGIIFENATQPLDWIYWDNVIFRDCIIRYSGKPVILKNVAFENCQFEFVPETNGVDLSREVLASNVVNHSERSAVLNRSKFLNVQTSLVMSSSIEGVRLMVCEPSLYYAASLQNSGVTFNSYML
jgi:hypothetical protein